MYRKFNFIRNYQEKNNNCYSSKAVNINGDLMGYPSPCNLLVTSRTTKRHPFYSETVVLDTRESYANHNITTEYSFNGDIEALELIKEFGIWANDNHITFYISYPNRVYTNNLARKSIMNKYKWISDYFDKNNINQLGTAYDFFYPVDYMNDTKFHMNHKGSLKRTEDTIKLMDKAIFNKEFDHSKWNETVSQELELYELEINQVYLLNEQKTKEILPILRYNWSFPEEFGAWTDGNEIITEFHIENYNGEELEIFMPIIHRTTNSHFEIFVNSVNVEYVIESNTLKFPINVNSSENNKVRIRLSFLEEILSPREQNSELTESGKLGLGFESIEIREIN